MDNEKHINILHLSDIQFGRNHRFGRLGYGGADEQFDTLLQRVVDDVAMLIDKNNLAPDVVALTGDLAEWALPKEYGDVLTFCIGLRDRLHLAEDRLLIIPGNHDINRSLCEAYFLRCSGTGQIPAEPWWPKWEPYVDGLFSKLYANVPRYVFSPEQPYTFFEIPELGLVVAGLNSTMRESHADADPHDPKSIFGHYGHLGEAQLDWFGKKLEAAAAAGQLRLGLVHHNVVRGAADDDENLRDAALLRDRLEGKLHLLLHGHTHRATIEWLGRLPVVSTGSAAVGGAQRPEEVPNQYQMIRLSRGGMERWARQYDPQTRKWIGDTRVAGGSDWYHQEPMAFSQSTQAFAGVRPTLATGRSTAQTMRTGDNAPRVPGADPSISPTTGRHASVSLRSTRFYVSLRNDQTLDRVLERHAKTGDQGIDAFLELLSSLGRAGEGVEVVAEAMGVARTATDADGLLSLLVADFVCATRTSGSMKWLIGRTARNDLPVPIRSFLTQTWSVLAAACLDETSPGYSTEFAEQFVADVRHVFADDASGNRLYRFFDVAWSGLGAVPAMVRTTITFLEGMHTDATAPQRRARVKSAISKGRMFLGEARPDRPELVEIPVGGDLAYSFQAMTAPITNAECMSLGIDTERGDFKPFRLGPWKWTDGPDGQYPDVMRLLRQIVAAYDHHFPANGYYWALPTCAEWLRLADCEVADYPWGGEMPSVSRANLMFERVGRGHRRLMPVKSYPEGRSSFGAYDCCGNIHELVAIDSALRVPADVRLMGGSYLTRVEHSSCRVARRVRRREPDTRRNIGVRLVMIRVRDSHRRQWEPPSRAAPASGTD